MLSVTNSLLVKSYLLPTQRSVTVSCIKWISVGMIPIPLTVQSLLCPIVDQPHRQKGQSFTDQMLSKKLICAAEEAMITF